MPESTTKGENQTEEPGPRSRLVPILGGVAGAAQLPGILMLADYFLAERQPGVEHFAVGIIVGGFLGVLAGARLSGPIAQGVVGRSYPFALLFGVPASLLCGGGFMMGGGSPGAAAVIFALYCAGIWGALAVVARDIRSKPR